MIRINIFWRDEDGVYIADVTKLSGCWAFGDSYEAALREERIAVSQWIDTAK